MVSRVLTLFALLAVPAPAAERTAQLDGAAAVVSRLEAAAMAGDRGSIVALGIPGTTPATLGELADILTNPLPTRVVLKERDRTAIADGGHRLLLEVFTEYGVAGALGTWSLDVRRRPGTPDDWAITDLNRLSVVTGLYRLALDTQRSYDVHNLVVRSTDVTLQMASGRAYLANTPEGTTAVVLLGRGQMHFTPPDPAERTQLRIFAGHESFSADFDAAFVRVRPAEFEERFPPSALRPRPADVRELRRAEEVFDEYIGRTLQIDLADLSRDEWSLVPNPTDLIAEVRTRKHGSLTYTRSHNDAEDIALFDRRRRRNICVYASAQKLAERGRFYSEDDIVDYDVLNYDIDVDVSPERAWFVGNVRVTLKVRAPAVNSLTMRLAEPLAVRAVYANRFGRLLHLRVVNQNSLIVNLPTAVLRDTELTLQVVYSGRLQPQTFDREAIAVGTAHQEPMDIPLEPRYIYSNRSYWYPQSTVTDYATASMRIVVPADYSVVASGDPAGPPAPPAGVVESGQRPRRAFVFEASKPARYLGFVVSRFSRLESTRLTTAELFAASEQSGDGHEARTAAGELTLHMQANPRQVGRARGLSEKAAAVFRFYTSVLGEAPYPSFTLAVTESERPGGHSPPYFAVLNQVMPTAGVLQWRNDPVSFENYPTFFLAHEIAHQWWGQAIGWKNYHEQWISEGFAQYFAALYAEKERSEGSLDNLLRQMRHTAVEASSQGPIYLGYRLGHVKGDDRVFRSVIYNKSAMVLHMLRRVVGDDAFFGGVRDFYTQWKFRKAGTDDFRRVMEQASGRDLSRFFETWVHGTAVPRVKFTHAVEDADIVVKFEFDDAVDVPITVTIVYENGEREDVGVAISERVTERRLRLKGPMRSVEANADNAALVTIQK